MKQSVASSLGFNFVVHEDFERDLDALEDESDEQADLAAGIAVYVDELREHPEVLQRLLDNKSVFRAGKSCEFDVRELVEAKRNRYSLWRLRLLDDESSFGGYRVIYAYNPTDRTFYVLGLMPRAVNYDLCHPRLRRILGTYQDLEIRRL